MAYRFLKKSLKDLEVIILHNIIVKNLNYFQDNLPAYIYSIHHIMLVVIFECCDDFS